MKNYFCSFAGNILCLHNHFISVAKAQLIIASNTNYRYYITLFVKIQVSQSMCISKCFAAIFKIPDVMAMPYNAQWVCLIKTNGYFCFFCQEFFHALMVLKRNTANLNPSSLQSRGKEYNLSICYAYFFFHSLTRSPSISSSNFFIEDAHVLRKPIAIPTFSSRRSVSNTFLEPISINVIQIAAALPDLLMASITNKIPMPFFPPKSNPFTRLLISSSLRR